MNLQYLDFETSDDGEGGAGFDALASVSASRWPQLAAEAAAVLAWAQAEFGPPASVEEGGDWDFALHGSEEHSTALELRWDPAQALVLAQRSGESGEPRRTLALTISCSAGLADAFRQALR